MKKLFIIIALFIGISQVAFAGPAAPPKRIVSLAPSMTEILYALGLGDNIVGVTTFCDYPEDAKKKTKIGGMSNPSLEAVVSLKPDIVVLTTDGNPKEFEERLVSLKINTFVFQARRLVELPQGVREMAAALGVTERGDRLARELEEGIRKAAGVRGKGNIRNQETSASRLPPPASRKKVLFIVWPEPLMVAGPGTVIDDAFVLLGLENIAGAAETAYPKYSIEEVLHRAPDIIFIGKSMGLDMRSVSGGVLSRMSSVPAVKNNRVFYVSDKLFRLGPRVVRGIEELAACLK